MNSCRALAALVLAACFSASVSASFARVRSSDEWHQTGGHKNGDEHQVLLGTDASQKATPAKKMDPLQTPGSIQDVETEVSSTVNKVKKTTEKSPAQMLREDLRLVVENFMPGKRPEAKLLFGVPAACAAVGLLWMVVYLSAIYRNDRKEHLDGWSHRTRFPRHEDERIAHIKPDVILLFHHPNHPCGEKDSAVGVDTIRACMVERHVTPSSPKKNGEGLTRLTGCCLKAEGLAPKSSALGKLSRSLANFTGTPRQVTGEGIQGKSEEIDEEAEYEQQETVTLGSAREALLQDLYSMVHDAGFEVVSFSSIDDDEIFVGISIGDPEIVREELIRSNIKLQLDYNVAEKLNIGQNRDQLESSPPFMKYDARLARNILGEEATDLDMYKTFHGRHKQGFLIAGTERIRLVHRHLSKHVDLDMAVQQGMLKDWYPVHSIHGLAELQACWSGLDLFKDFSFVQPMTLLQEYFGSRLAFTLAWNGLYCKLLLALLPCALVFDFLNQLDLKAKGAFTAFSIVLVIWGKIVSNLWQREQEYFMLLWDLNTTPDYSVRPDFIGTLQESDVDSTQQTKAYPRNWYVARQAVAWIVTIVFCLVVAVSVYVWISVFEGRLDIGASIFLALMIQVFQFIYNGVAEYMTKKENHKYQVDFYNSYLMKLFIFQFVNQFSAYFFIAIKQQHTTWGCPNGDCIELLRYQLSMTLFLLSLMRIGQVVFSSVKVRVIMWWEDRAIQKECEGTGQEVPYRGFLEEQAKYEDYRIRQQIEGMIQLVVALGYVLIFGAVAPRIVPLCLILFIVQLRLTAYMTTTSCRRPLPRKSTGLGAWIAVVQFLISFGIVFSAYLLVCYGPSFQGTFLITKVSGAIAYVVSMYLACQVASLCCPPTSNGAQLLHARRNYVLSKVADANEEANIAKLKKKFAATQQLVSADTAAEATHAEEILSGAWDQIPHLIDDDAPVRRASRCS